MTYLSIIDKLIILFNLLKESSFLLIFIGILILAIILRILKKISNSRLFMIVVLSLFGTFLSVLFMNYDILSKTFDNFIDIIFTNIYFPSIYVYLFIIFSSYVIVIVTLLNKKISYISRIANYSMAFILNLILILNLNIIAKDKVDIFSMASMYTNINLVSMLELSMNVYILWMVVISAVFIINHVTDNIIIRRESKKLLKEPVKIDTGIIEIDTSKLEEEKEEVISSPVVVNTNVVTLNIEDSVSDNIDSTISSTVEQELKQEEVTLVSSNKFIDSNVIEEIQNNLEKSNNNVYTFNQYVKAEEKQLNNPVVNPILTQILNNTLPIQKEDVKESNEVFTLNDYKTFSKMLKEAIKLNNRTTLNVDDMLNLNLLNKFSYEEYSLFKRMLKSYTN